MKRFAELTEQEVLALAITNEDEDSRIYRGFAEGLRKTYPASAKVFDEMADEELPLDEVEKRHILRTLEYTDWNKSQAAAILSIERSTLDRKIKVYDLKR